MIQKQPIHQQNAHPVYIQNPSKKGRKYKYDSSFNNFNLYLQKSKEKRSSSQNMLSNRNQLIKTFQIGNIEIQKLNLTNISMSKVTASKTDKFNNFLPPKGIHNSSKDKYMNTNSMNKINRILHNNNHLHTYANPHRSNQEISSNNNGRKISQFGYESQIPKLQFSRRSTSRNDIQNQNNFTDQYYLDSRSLKLKLEANAMKNFKQLFQKQIQQKNKHVQQQHSKRLINLLENTKIRNKKYSLMKQSQPTQRQFQKQLSDPKPLIEKSLLSQMKQSVKQLLDTKQTRQLAYEGVKYKDEIGKPKKQDKEIPKKKQQNFINEMRKNDSQQNHQNIPSPIKQQIFYKKPSQQQSLKIDLEKLKNTSQSSKLKPDPRIAPKQTISEHKQDLFKKKQKLQSRNDDLEQSSRSLASHSSKMKNSFEPSFDFNDLPSVDIVQKSYQKKPIKNDQPSNHTTTLPQSLKSIKQPKIKTIKQVKQVKSSQQNIPSKPIKSKPIQRYDDDDQLEEVNLGIKKEVPKNIKDNTKVNQTDNRDSTSQFSSTTPQMASLLNTKLSNKPQTKLQPQQSREMFNESDDQDIAGQVLDLIDLIDNLGSFNTGSKQFYSSADSSMVQIVMNHKLAAYYISNQFYFYQNAFLDRFSGKTKGKFYHLEQKQLKEALQDTQVQESIQTLKHQSEIAIKLIKHCFEKCKLYLKKQQKVLNISPSKNYHSQSIQYLKLQFTDIYKLYQKNKKSLKTLAERLCYLIQIYDILMCLKGQDRKVQLNLDQIQDFQKHIEQYKGLLM